jgi:hypothetical protein
MKVGVYWMPAFAGMTNGVTAGGQRTVTAVS